MIEDRYIPSWLCETARETVEQYSGDDDNTRGLARRIDGWIDNREHVTATKIITDLLHVIVRIRPWCSYSGEERAEGAPAPELDAATRGILDNIRWVNLPSGIEPMWMGPLPVSEDVEALLDSIDRAIHQHEDIDLLRARTQIQELEREVFGLRNAQARIAELERQLADARDVEREAIKTKHHASAWDRVLSED